ncbi:MAG: peptidylprolyl isomerase [Candidatus Latescibacterota bacterium]
MNAAEAAILTSDPDDLGEVAVIQTAFGRIVFAFYPKDAPNHVKNFKKLAKMGFFNGTTFHRLIPGFMIQGGDPNTKDDNRANDGLGGPGYTIDAEFNARKHIRGTVSMARGPDPNSAGSQFFICVAPAAHLDRSYTAFGEVTQGMDVVDEIMKVDKDRKGNPIKKVEMTVSIVDRAKASK